MLVILVCFPLEVWMIVLVMAMMLMVTMMMFLSGKLQKKKDKDGKREESESRWRSSTREFCSLRSNWDRRSPLGGMFCRRVELEREVARLFILRARESEGKNTTMTLRLWLPYEREKAWTIWSVSWLQGMTFITFSVLSPLLSTIENSRYLQVYSRPVSINAPTGSFNSWLRSFHASSPFIPP